MLCSVKEIVVAADAGAAAAVIATMVPPMAATASAAAAVRLRMVVMSRLLVEVPRPGMALRSGQNATDRGCRRASGCSGALGPLAGGAGRQPGSAAGRMSAALRSAVRGRRQRTGGRMFQA